MKILTIFALLFVLTIAAHARTWISADGRGTMEAEFISADDKTVTLKRGTQEVTMALDKFSAADRQFVAAQVAAAKEPPVVELGEFAKYATGQWVKGEEKGLPFQIYAPPSFIRGKPLPLVIFLHGVGATGTDNEKQVNVLPKTFASAKNQEKRPCIVVAPQCPPTKGWTGRTREIVALTKFIAQHLPVDPLRIYLGGYSMGGFGVWATLAEDPKLFAAGLPIAGGGKSEDARKLKDIPIWAFHGEVDETVSVTGSRTMVDALKKVNGMITYTELAGEGHKIPVKVVTDEKVQEWLFNQKR